MAIEVEEEGSAVGYTYESGEKLRLLLMAMLHCIAPNRSHS